MAEEDYRQYPVRFAGFVNLARQIFIENELCLVGFSGDDPNFLQWSGWVRDNLADSARRIYLVGALNLPHAKRNFLEAMNVAPIDLFPLVRDVDSLLRHQTAIDIFLSYLSSAKPKLLYDWSPAHQSKHYPPILEDDLQRRARDDEYAAALTDEAAKQWKIDRETYPEWFACPRQERSALQATTSHAPYLRQGILDALSPLRRAEILYEIAWRHSTAQWPIDPFLAEALAAIAFPSPALGKQQKRELAVLLLRRAREVADENELNRWASVIDADSETDLDQRSEVAFQRCLFLRDKLDFEAMRTMAAGMAGPRSYQQN